MPGPKQPATGRRARKGPRVVAIVPPVASVGPAEIEACYDRAPIGMCVVDLQFRYLRINELLAEMNGRSVAEHLGRTIREVIPQIAPLIERMLRRVMRTGRPILNLEVTGETPAHPGETRTWLASWHPLKNHAGRIVALSCMAHEITEQKRAEGERDRLLETLELERARLTTVLEQMPAGVIIVEAPSGRSLFDNKESARIFRHPFRPAEEIAEYGCWKLFRPDGSPLPLAEYPLARAVLRGATTTDEELMIERGDGSRGVISANAAPVRDRQRKIVAAVVTFFDITEQRETLGALRESEEKFRKIAENSPLGLGIYNTAGKIHFLNPKLLEIVGWRPREVPDLQTWFSKVYPDPVYRREVEDTWKGDIRRVQRGELTHSPVREYRVTCRDGSEKICEVTFALGADHTYAVFSDVTSRIRATEALREATEFMRALLESAPIPIYVRDAAHRYRLVNREWERLFRRKRAEVIGRAITEVLPAKLAESLEKANRQVLARERTVSTEETVDFPEGRQVFHTVKFPLRNAAGRVDAVGGISIDMTQRIRAEEEFLRLNAELEERVLERTEELATANQELRREIGERVRLQSELLEISEREQRRLGQDLHDELGQQLTGLGLMLAAFEQELKVAGHPRAALVTEFSELLRKAVTATRDLAKGFYPVVLEEGGLLVALQDLAHRTNAIAGVRCAIRHRGSFRFKKAQAIHLYRIAQEAVSNALKHGKPRTIEIVLTVQRGRSVMRIFNDGRAFKPPAAGNGGFGLQLMRYRGRSIGAEVAFSCGPKGGCEVVCTLGPSVAGA